MTANDKNSCLCYLSELIDEYNNTYQRFIGKKLLDADYHYLLVLLLSFFFLKLSTSGKPILYTTYLNKPKKRENKFCYPIHLSLPKPTSFAHIFNLPLLSSHSQDK